MQQGESVIGSDSKPAIIASTLQALKYICYLPIGVGFAKAFKPAIRASPSEPPSAFGLRSADPAVAAA
jgi:hypothetical protein